MNIKPDTNAFTATYEAGRAQVVWTTLVADLETPVSAMLKLTGGNSPGSFLLESVEGGNIRGRYSFIGMDPDLVWRCSGDAAEINRDANKNPAAFVPCPVAEQDGTLASLRALLKESEIHMPDGLPPMAAGLVGYMGYDTIRLVEAIPDVNPDPLDLPEGMFVRPTVIAVFDTIEDTISIVTPVRPKEGIKAADALTAAQTRLANAVSALDRPVPHTESLAPLQKDSGGPAEEHKKAAEPKSNMSKDEYCRMIETAKDYILAGEIFQVVLSQRFSVPFTLPPFSLYRALRRLNPSPFLFFLNFVGFSVVGSSPEILVRVRDGKVTIRPIAGTRPRGADAAEDKALAEDLLGDPKELAEHLMLLDLGRNDVGRVAKIGTVNVTDQMVIEYYSHVMHIVSNVEGMLDEKYDLMDALMAGFPAGTVSGAPKVRAMEIIDELEPERRGVYAGCIGYFGAGGTMDTCIALRTAVVKDGTMYVQAGGGVVYDSTPEGEFEESRNKARALLRAAQDAVSLARGAS